ncbi:ERF family protein [Cytobacillus praedii]|uniref:ERF family protein n=1 Tax=Cytobacillus praedii TaxID=1742358 RepID=UPI00070AB282|nr:ERF family protein [Cytobacillus praedii]
MSQLKSIYSKIGDVMSKVSRVPKNGYNSFHKYNYATESDLTESIRPILQESGLAFFSNVLEQDREGEFTKVKMEFTLADIETGEVLTSTYWGEGQDKGDKGLYKAYTGATKYFLMKTFLIPTGDDPEADSTVDERNSQKTKNNKGQKTQPQMASDAQLNLINKLLVDVANTTGSTKEKAYKSLKNQMKKEMEWYTQEEAGEAIVILNKVLKKGA